MRQAGLDPDPWQQRVLRSEASRMLLCCARQVGKSTTTAALALLTAFLEAPALILLLSPTLRQSGELFRDKVLRLYEAAGRPVPPAKRPTQTELHLANGSRIVSLPESEANIRGFSSVRLLVIDEGSRVVDDLYRAVRPMLSVSKGRLIGLSSPFGKRGWFFDEWAGTGRWDRVRVTADECPRITPEFLAEEREALGDRWFRQEYFCTFEEAIDAVFLEEDITASLRDRYQPLHTE
jgi:hypothetical protein